MKRFAISGREISHAAACGERAPSGAGTKRVDTYGFYPLGTPVSLCLLARRKSESGDRSERRERQRIFFTVGAHIVRLFSVLHKQNYVPMAMFHKQGTTNFVKNRLCGKILFSV